MAKKKANTNAQSKGEKKPAAQDEGQKKGQKKGNAKGKIGQGALSAAGRLGLDELRNGLSFGQESIEAPTPMGALGHPTPEEVSKERAGEKTTLEDQVQEAEVEEPEVVQGQDNEQGLGR